MKLYKIGAIAFSFIAGVSLTGCSDSDDWTPGPVDDETGVEAYFATTTKEYIFGKDEAVTLIKVPVARRVTDGEATVGIIFNCKAEGIECPSEVTFEDGESETTLVIDCSDMPYGEFIDLSARIAPDDSNIYGAGINQVDLSVIKADWILIADNVRYLYSDFDYAPIYPNTYSNMYQLEGTYVFKLEDFFGSGLDIKFEVDPAKCDYHATVLYPRNNADFENVYAEDKPDLGWYLYDEANVSWPTWTPGDVEGYPAIEYLLLYGVIDYNFMDMIYNSTTLYGYVGLTVGIDFDNGDFQWGSFQVDWKLKYNPFETNKD